MSRSVRVRRGTLLESLESRRLFATFSVTTTADSGAGSLRQAITSSNSSGGADTIQFALGSDHVIRPTAALPAITDTLTIDGTSQSGYADKPLVEINGKLAGAAADCITVKGAGALTMTGIAITSFGGNGVVLASSSGSTIQACTIGVDGTGKFARGNAGNGIVIAGSSNNKIGGTDVADANTIANNGTESGAANVSSTGILLYGSGNHNTMEGNSIYNNAGRGIDIARSGKVPDSLNQADFLDTDSGTNDLINHPFPTQFLLSPTETSVFGQYRARPGVTYRIEVFGNTFNASTRGGIQMQKFLFAFDITADQSSDPQYLKSFLFQGPPTSYALYALTATDPEGNTSEVSLAFRSQAGTLTGTVFDDANGNGVREDSEGVLAGQTVFLDFNSNGTLDSDEPSALTNSKGKYSLANEPGGSYPIRAVIPTGFRSTSPATEFYTVSLPTSKSLVRNFGLTTTAIVRGTVFDDTDGSAARDTGEDGLDGWTVYIDKNNNGVFDAGEKSRITNSLGDYRFAGLTPGTYVIRIVMQEGFVQTVPTANGPQALKLAVASSRSNRLFGVKASA